MKIKTRPLEPKTWSLTKEERDTLRGMANVIGFIHDLVEEHMSKWIDVNVKTRLSVAPGQLVTVSLEKGEVSLVIPDGKDNPAKPGVHEELHAEEKSKPAKSSEVQPVNADVASQPQGTPPKE